MCVCIVWGLRIYNYEIILFVFFYTFSFIKRCNGFIENTIIQLSIVHFKLSFFWDCSIKQLIKNYYITSQSWIFVPIKTVGDNWVTRIFRFLFILVWLIKLALLVLYVLHQLIIQLGD